MLFIVMVDNTTTNMSTPRLAVPRKIATQYIPLGEYGADTHEEQLNWIWAKVNGDWKQVSYSSAGEDEKAHSPDIFTKLDAKSTALNEGSERDYKMTLNNEGYFDRYVHANDGQEFMMAYGGKNSWYDPFSTHISSGLRLSFDDNGELKLTQMKYPSTKPRQEALGDIFTALDNEDGGKTIPNSDEELKKEFFADIKLGSASNYAVLDTFRQFAGNYIENLAFKILKNDGNADTHRVKIKTFLTDLKEQGYSSEDIRDIANKALLGLKDDRYDLGQGGLAKLNLVLRDKELLSARSKPSNVDKVNALLSEIQKDSGAESFYGSSVQGEKSHKDFIEAFKYGLEKIGISGIKDLDKKVKELLVPPSGVLNLSPGDDKIKEFLDELAQESSSTTATPKPAENSLTVIDTPWANKASEIFNNPTTNDHKYLAKMILESQAKLNEFFEMFPELSSDKKKDYVFKLLNSKPEYNELLTKIGTTKAKEILGLIGF